MNRWSVTSLLLILALSSLGCGDSSPSPSHATASAHMMSVPWYVYGGPSPFAVTRHIVIGRLPHLGIVLVDGKGYPLYAFVPDNQGAPCTGACATTWPVFTLTREHVLDTSPALSLELIGIDPKERLPEGTRVVSYAGRLLHSYTGDTSPGVAKGQGLQSYGGHWYVLAASGKLVRTPSA